MSILCIASLTQQPEYDTMYRKVETRTTKKTGYAEAGTFGATLTASPLQRSELMAIDSLPRTPDSGQDLSPKVLARIHEASSNPEMLVDLLIALCPRLTPEFALSCLEEDSAFEQEAMSQAARLMGGEWEK